MKLETVSDFGSGEELVALMEILTETKCPYKIKAGVKMKMQKIDNCSNALKFVEDCGIKMQIKTSAENLIDGEVKSVLGLLWAIMKMFLKFSDDEDGPVLSIKDSLIMWFKNQVFEKEGIAATIKDVTKSFHSGIIIAATIEKYRPKLINVDSLNPECGEENLKKAFDAATEYFGLEQYLSPQEMLRLDEKSMIVFLSEFFYGIAAQRKIDLAAKRIMKVVNFTKENDAMRETYATKSDRLSTLLKSLEQKMEDRTIDNTMAGAKARVDGFYNYKTQEKGETVDSDYLSLETCANLLAMRLAQHERPPFNPAEGMDLKSFFTLLRHLEQSEGAMKKHLHTELNRQIKLAKINDQHTARCTNITAWGTEKKTYLQTKQDIASVGAADFQLRQLESFRDEAKTLRESNITHLVAQGSELRDEKYENSAAVTEREAGTNAMMDELDALEVERKKVADDDLAREQYKEQTMTKNGRHTYSHEQTTKWSKEKHAFLSKKEDISSIADAELHLSLLKAYMIERRDLEAVRVPPFKALGAEVLAMEYKSEFSAWKLDNVEGAVAALNTREEEVAACFPELDNLSTAKLAVLNDDLAREQFREKLRQDNVAHTGMFDALSVWLEAKAAYLAVKEPCASVAEAVTNLSNLASCAREEENMSNGAVPALKSLGESITTRKYETDLSSYVFPTPEEVADREGKVTSKWAELNAAKAAKQAILDDDLARELFKEQLRQDNEQHKSKHAKLKAWVDVKTAYLTKRDEVTSVTTAHENLNYLASYSAEKTDTTNGDVKAFKVLGEAILAAKYETALSSYVFPTPEEIAERRTFVEGSWATLDELYNTKHALAEDDLAREEFKEHLRLQNEQHKQKHATLIEWVGECKGYLEKKEDVHSVTEAQENLAAHSAYEEDKTIHCTGAITGLKSLGNDVTSAKYETALSSYVFATPEEVGARETEVDESIAMLDGLSATKKAILDDDLAREQFKEKLRGSNTTHKNDHATLKAWVQKQTEYLNKKEAVDSISDAQLNLATLLAYVTEKEYTTKGAVVNMKKLGQDILSDKYETALSSWAWETPAEITDREGEIDGDWAALDGLSATKQAVLDDDLAREEFRERLRLDNENHKLKQAWLMEDYAKGSVEYLTKTEEVDSIFDANTNLDYLNASELTKEDVTSFNVASINKLGAHILEAKYETELSSFVFATPAEVKEREAAVGAKWEELAGLATGKRAVLDADLVKEKKKEDLRLTFADAAADFAVWSKDAVDDSTQTSFGFTLAEVQAFKAALDGMDAMVGKSGPEKVQASKAIHTEMTELGVHTNTYTSASPATLDAIMSDTSAALATRQGRYDAELKRQVDNDALCQAFAGLVGSFVEAVEGVKASLTSEAGGDLETQVALINEKLSESDAAVVEMEGMQTQLDEAGVSFNIHTLITGIDVRLMWGSYQSFLVVKKKNIDDEIAQKKMRGLTQENYAELDKMFNQFDKSANKFLDKSEFKACLYSLGDERGSKEVMEIMKKFGGESAEEKGIGYEAFMEFMITELGDTDTAAEILYAFALINGDVSPAQKKRDQMNDEEKEAFEEQMAAFIKTCAEQKALKVMDAEYVEYMKATHAAEQGVQYDTWTASVFAR